MPNLRSDRGETSLDPAGVTPSRRLRTSPTRARWRAKDRKEGNETRGQLKGGVQLQASTATYLRLKAKQQKRPGEDSPLSKTSDKPVKSAPPITRSANNPKEDVRRRLLDPKKGVATSERKNHQGNPSFAIKSDKDTLDPKGDHIPKEYAGEANG